MKFRYSAGTKPLDGYTIKRTIHRGGFGEVYYALSDAGKEVAIKLLNDNMEIELRGVTQCLNLKHPHLVNIFDIKTDAEGDHWIIMEYVTGGTLGDIIDKHPQGLPKSQVIDIFNQCSDGLAFLHERGLVHRDLKPANIFSEDGTLKIGDVGLTKFISQTHRSAHTQSVGTVYYMAPEVAKGKYGKGVDIYAMGVIAYEMLTGHVPFNGESTGEILMKHLTEKPDLSMLDAPLAQVIGRALEKDEQKRFGSISALQQALTAAISGKPIATETMGNASVIDIDLDDGVHVANKESIKSKQNGFSNTVQQNITISNAGTAASINQTGTATHSNPPLITPDNFAAWWWIPLLFCFILLMTRSVFTFASIILAGLLVCSIIFFRKAILFWNQRESPPTVSPHTRRTRPWNAGRPQKRSGRLLTIDMFRGIALAPIMIVLIAASIVFLSQDFFSSAWSPQELDYGHVSFFVASSTLAVWMLMIFNRLFHAKNHNESGSRLINGFIGAICGVAVFGMGQWFMVEYPTQLFPSGSSGLVSSIGQHQLVSEEESQLIAWNNHHEHQENPHEIQKALTITHGEAGTRGVPEEDSASEEEDSTTQINSPSQKHWSPTMAGYAVFFGFLFAMRAWWQLGNFDRLHRFRLSSIALTVVIAYVICCVFTFPVVWAMTWAATIAAAIQLASPCRQIE